QPEAAEHEAGDRGDEDVNIVQVGNDFSHGFFEGEPDARTVAVPLKKRSPMFATLPGPNVPRSALTRARLLPRRGRA
ncbi:MAG: hypothetical protein ABSH26_18525, partial [Opitutaceae bacterium]